jgi:hypothetical protein
MNKTTKVPFNMNKITTLMDLIMKESDRQKMSPIEVLIALDFIHEFITDYIEMPTINITEIRQQTQRLYKDLAIETQNNQPGYYN